MFLNETPRPFLYLPLTQRTASPVTLHLRTTVPPMSLAAGTRAAIHAMDPELLVYDVKTMAIHLRDGIGLFFVRMGATLAGAVGLLGLAQTLVGLFGVLSYAVSQRTREIGIRLALGATARDVVRNVLGQGALLVALGLAVGLALSLALTRLMSSLLFGISAWDVTAYASASLVLAALGLVSCYLPARRAAKLEPSMALRRE